MGTHSEMLKSILPLLFGLSIAVLAKPTADTKTVEKLSGEWLVMSIQAELSPDQVTYHNSIPRKLYDQGRIGQKFCWSCQNLTLLPATT